MKTTSDSAKDLEQAKVLDDLITQANSLVNEGDRVPFFLTASGTFTQGSQKAFEMVFNVPADGDFFATRLNLLLEARLTSTVSPELNDRGYRPVDWTCAADRRNGAANFPLSPTMANALFEMRTADGPYSNLPVAITSVYSARHGIPMWQDTRASPLVSTYNSGLDFPVDEVMRRGTATTIKVTPLFSVRSTVTTSVLEYRVQGVFTGFKRVKAFAGEGFPFTLTR